MQKGEQNFLVDCNDLIQSLLTEIPSGDFFSYAQNNLINASSHLCLSENAKRARPQLCFYYHQIFSNNFDENLAKIAVASEFIHTASLLHDDVIDCGETRRGSATVNRLYGNTTSILSGNFLLTQGIKLLKNLDRTINDRAVEVIQNMSSAAMLEILSRKDLGAHVNSWRQIALGKTGALFAWCGFAVAKNLGLNSEAELLSKVGNHIGLIFQMTDDVKDLEGDNNLKDYCRDLRNLDPSLPIILAWQKNSQIKKEFASAVKNNFIDDEGVGRLKQLIIESGSLHEVKSLIDQEIQAIKKILATFNGREGYTKLCDWIDSLYAEKFSK